MTITESISRPMAQKLQKKKSFVETQLRNCTEAMKRNYTVFRAISF